MNFVFASQLIIMHIFFLTIGGCSQVKRRRLSSSPANRNKENFSSIACRTRSHRPSVSPKGAAHDGNQVEFVDNPEVPIVNPIFSVALLLYKSCQDLQNAYDLFFFSFLI